MHVKQGASKQIVTLRQMELQSEGVRACVHDCGVAIEAQTPTETCRGRRCGASKVGAGALCP